MISWRAETLIRTVKFWNSDLTRIFPIISAVTLVVITLKLIYLVSYDFVKPFMRWQRRV